MINKLKEYFRCETKAESGIVYIKQRKGSRKKIGESAGLLNNNGYFQIFFEGKQHQVHRVVWMLCHGEIPEGLFVDHIDGNRANNAIDNLRLATPSQNQHNRKTNKGSLEKGISLRKDGYYHSSIWLNGKCYQKASKDKNTVLQWRDEKRKELHGDFARS